MVVAWLGMRVWWHLVSHSAGRRASGAVRSRGKHPESDPSPPLRITSARAEGTLPQGLAFLVLAP
ncbi:hypothetical protein IQ62_23160 [Streptomyces scabiei]|nr:hypothetical protein IQ62_23160 [Streptomyces scabiei]